ncbi:MAG: accessory factor UbiK family protein [Hyphomonadaceae bacterium]
MQTRNPFLDEFSKLATSAAGVAQGVGEEARAFWRSQMERMVLDMDLVRRDEFDAVKDLAAAARAEADSLKARLDALEASMKTPAKAPSKAATPKKSAKSS